MTADSPKTSDEERATTSDDAAASSGAPGNATTGDRPRGRAVREPGSFEVMVQVFPVPLVVRGGSFEPSKDPRWAEVLEAARSRLEAILGSVGRLECPENTMPQRGTAWLVRDDVAVTNRHTILTLLDDLTRGDKTLRIDFCAEVDAAADRRCAVRRVLYVAPDHDLAFVQLAAPLPRVPAIPLADRIVPAHPLATVGFPSDESSRYGAEVFEDSFKDGFDRAGQGFKRISLGHVEAITGSIVEHDCTTLGGSSGSVIVDLVRGEAIGLNFGAAETRERSRPANLGVPAWIVRERLDRLDR